MKLYEDRAEMEAIPRIRRPTSVHTLDQVVGQASRGSAGRSASPPRISSARNAAPSSGSATPRTTAWQSGQHMVGVWYSATLRMRAPTRRRWNACRDGRFEALALSPLASGRLDPPDIALFYATPGAMIYFINGLQWSGYKRFDWSVRRRDRPAPIPGAARSKTREPSLSIPCFAERRYGGVLDDEMLMALPPDYLPKAIAGMEALAKNGLALSVPAIRHPAGRAAPGWRSAIPAEADLSS